MNLNNVLKIIEEALQSNLETIILMLIVVTTLYGINILFGTIIGSIKDSFSLKKFLFGIQKALLTDIGIFAFCYVLNLFALTLQLTKDISISADFINTIEVFTILVVWALDLAKDIIEKIKSMKTLKYVTYDDVQINPSKQEELG